MALINIDSFDAYGPAGPVIGTMKWDFLWGSVGPGRRANGYGLWGECEGIKYVDPGVSDFGIGVAVYWSGGAVFGILWGLVGGYLEPHADWFISIDAEGKLVAQEVTLQAPGPTWQPAATLFTTDATHRLVANAWNFIELKFDSGTATVRINKNTAGSGSLTSGPQLGWGFHLPINRGMGIDDWHLFSVDAETPDFLGDRAIEAYLMASVDTAEWTPKTGADNRAMIDENPSDEEETYNHTDQAERTDLFQLDPAGITDLSLEVFGLQLSVRAEKVNTASMDLVPVIVSGLTESAGPRWGLGSGYGTFIHPLATNPDTGLPWTVAEVLAAKYGYRSKAALG